MSDYEDIIPTEEVIIEREDSWLKYFTKYGNLDDKANEATDISFEDILDYEEDKDDPEKMCTESKYDSDDENNKLNEKKDEILMVAVKRKKIFNEKGLYDKLNFFDQNQGHHSMNWMQSNFSQSFGFGQHASVSLHRQEISVFHYSNNSQMSFSNYFNNTSVMQTPHNFYNPLLRNNSLQSINVLQPIDKRELDFRQRSFSTDSFRKNPKNSNLAAIEDVKVNGDLSSTGVRNNLNCQRQIHTSCDSSDIENRSQQRNRIKKTTKNYKSKKTNEAIQKPQQIFVLSSESDSELTVTKKDNGKKQNIHRSEINLAGKYIPTSESIERDRIKITEKEVFNFDADKTLTEDKMPPSRGRSQKTTGEWFFYYCFCCKGIFLSLSLRQK